VLEATNPRGGKYIFLIHTQKGTEAYQVVVEQHSSDVLEKLREQIERESLQER